ncbi:hypothetical protein [Metabacillus malikii]|uniref:mRNA-degrading endonuclease RelE of RelBE toxin-antitoxin system n=1 Tax=Metabacillus malikii TaxID=1504265 RepID=A0ABT9ZHG9_9BACI|nr:hypothetical protein [Metabacillus malikii]MDQ0231728.1 mRNA-degrading endonuclease RelE of RelBE toxin-antitoxin system [Metabacillus malikii]
MTQVLEVRKLSEVNEELQQLSKECEKAFSAWIRDRENTKLFVEYKELLKKRRLLISEYRSYFLIK